ncbi:hypothetical protein [Moraxella oblonga]|uniref:hypothetical protein n=1 Tax=Moraxella oblonga TaxID=200413 RepID=UPI000830242D|nr:hypothetical protein [Moraxella oblonga]
MKVIKLTALMLVASVMATGCSTIKAYTSKRNDGSLKYQQSQKLDPIQLPVGQQTADFTPLYATPQVEGGLSNFTNEAGRQYELPKPPQVR